MSKLGLNFLLDPKDMCSVLTTVFIPPHISVAHFQQKLRKKSIIIYEGKGCFKGRVFQVGNIGELSNRDIRFFLAAQKEILEGFKRQAPTQVASVRDHIQRLPIFNEQGPLVRGGIL